VPTWEYGGTDIDPEICKFFPALISDACARLDEDKSAARVGDEISSTDVKEQYDAGILPEYTSQMAE
jgi:hypothetical protein